MFEEDRTLLIRCDAGPHVGVGHLMRCLALAEAWQATGGKVAFATGELPSPLAARLDSQSYEQHTIACGRSSTKDADATARLVWQLAANWVVVDGYQFSADYQREIKTTGAVLLVLDDFGHADHYHADFVLNQNLSATEATYADRDSDTHLLLGTRYTLLRSEFLAVGASRASAPAAARRLLVTLGGADPNNQTAAVIRALRQLGQPDWEATVVVGPANEHLDSLRQLADETAGVSLAMGVESMVPLMQQADLAISAAGSTSWELLHLGVPTMLLVTAENQRPSANKLHATGHVSCPNLEHELSDQELAAEIDQLMADQPRRAALSAQGCRLVDGQGAQRVVAQLQNQRAFHNLRRTA